MSIRKAYVIGSDGNVGSAVTAALRAEGWTVAAIGPDDSLPLDGSAVVDAGPPGRSGWAQSWANYYGAVERCVRLLGEAERAGYAAAVFFSTDWIAAGKVDAYADSKALIEAVARTHNQYGSCVAIVDRVGWHGPEQDDATRFARAVRQTDGQLGERVVAAILEMGDIDAN